MAKATQNGPVTVGSGCLLLDFLFHVLICLPVHILDLGLVSVLGLLSDEDVAYPKEDHSDSQDHPCQGAVQNQSSQEHDVHGLAEPRCQEVEVHQEHPEPELGQKQKGCEEAASGTTYHISIVLIMLATLKWEPIMPAMEIPATQAMAMAEKSLHIQAQVFGSIQILDSW